MSISESGMYQWRLSKSAVGAMVAHHRLMAAWRSKESVSIGG